MKTYLRLVVIVVAAALALPLSGASEAGLASSGLTVAGDITVSAAAEALFVPLGSEGVSWDAVASSIVIERAYSNATRVNVPGASGTEFVGDSPAQVRVQDVQSFGAARLASKQTRADATLLVTSLGAPFEAAGATRGFLDADAEDDPAISSNEGSSVEVASGESIDYGVGAELVGAFVNLTSGRATYELRGTLVLQVYGTDYEVRGEGAESAQRTGYYPTSPSGPVERHRYEVHRITLTDAVLLVDTPGTAVLYAREPVVDFDGSLRTEGGEGSVTLGSTRFSADEGGAEYRGRGTLALEAADGLLAARSTGAAAAGSGVALGTAPAPALLVGGAVLLGLAALAVLAVALRRRVREPSLEAALLAMEERRWQDALDHLERIVASAPADPVLLVDRAICYEETGRLEQARADYEAALVEAPGNAEAHYYYSRVLARLRMSTACLAHLSRALALDERLAELARKEPAFQAFRDHPQFLGYLGE